MIPGVMITNGGPHSAEKWAVMTASQIIQVASTAAGADALEGRRLENKIIDILEVHHDAVQKHERGKLKEIGADRLTHPLDPAEHNVKAKVDEIVAAAKGSRFESHFAQPNVQAHITATIGSHFATSMDIERSWHADGLLKNDPNHVVAKAYRRVRGEKGAQHAHLHIKDHLKPAAPSAQPAPAPAQK